MKAPAIILLVLQIAGHILETDVADLITRNEVRGQVDALILITCAEVHAFLTLLAGGVT